MAGTVSEIRFDPDNLTEAIPVYLAIIAMPLFYSISEGVSLSIISHVLLIAAASKGKKVSPLMYIPSALFVLNYIFLRYSKSPGFSNRGFFNEPSQRLS